MTQHPPHPQQYIITEGDLNCIEQMLGRKSALVQAVRSRPHTTPASHQRIDKPCFKCRVPDQNNGACCLDETNCVDIAKWERENIITKKVLALMEAFKKETIEDGNDFYDGYIDEAIALLREGE